MKARVLPTENSFSAAFAGTYDFAVAANTGQTVFKMQANSVYYLDNFTVGGNIAREDFLSAISTTPVITLSRKRDGQLIYIRSIPITQFYENKECTCFVDSQKGDDQLLISMAGILKQTANLVGVSPILLTVSFAAFVIDDTEFNAMYRDRLAARGKL